MKILDHIRQEVSRPSTPLLILALGPQSKDITEHARGSSSCQSLNIELNHFKERVAALHADVQEQIKQRYIRESKALAVELSIYNSLQSWVRGSRLPCV